MIEDRQNTEKCRNKLCPKAQVIWELTGARTVGSVLANEFAKTFQKWIKRWEWCSLKSVTILKKKYYKEQYMCSIG